VSSQIRSLREGAHGVLIVKILNKCILSILVYNLFLDSQRNILYIYIIFPYIGILAAFMK